MKQIVIFFILCVSHKWCEASQLYFPFKIPASITNEGKLFFASSPIEFSKDTNIMDIGYYLFRTNPENNVFAYSEIKWIVSKYIFREVGGNSFWDIITISDVYGGLFPQADFKFNNLFFSKDILLPFPNFLTGVNFMEFKGGNFIININVEFPEFFYGRENYILNSEFIFLESKRSIVENFIYQIIWRNGISLDWLRK